MISYLNNQFTFLGLFLLHIYVYFNLTFYVFLFNNIYYHFYFIFQFTFLSYLYSKLIRDKLFNKIIAVSF